MFIEKLSDEQINAITRSIASTMVNTKIFRKQILNSFKIERAKYVEEEPYINDQYEILDAIKYKINGVSFLLTDYFVSAEKLLRISTDRLHLPVLLFKIYGEDYEKEFINYAKDHYTQTEEQLHDWLRNESLSTIPVIDKNEEELAK